MQSHIRGNYTQDISKSGTTTVQISKLGLLEESCSSSSSFPPLPPLLYVGRKIGKRRLGKVDISAFFFLKKKTFIFFRGQLQQEEGVEGGEGKQNTLRRRSNHVGHMQLEASIIPRRRREGESIRRRGLNIDGFQGQADGNELNQMDRTVYYLQLTSYCTLHVRTYRYLRAARYVYIYTSHHFHC